MFYTYFFVYILFFVVLSFVMLLLFKKLFYFRFNLGSYMLNCLTLPFIGFVLYSSFAFLMFSFKILHFSAVSSLPVYFVPNFYFYFFYINILVTLLSLIFCLSYNKNESFLFSIYISLIWVAGMGLFFSDSVTYFFYFYECLLVPSFLILYKFSKTRKSVEAAYLMFFWTQFGALFLIFIFLYLAYITQSTLFLKLKLTQLTTFESSFLFWCLIFGFGVKLPLWPFYDWLPKAHVEASTNFSIFLSGVLVKFAFFGLFKCLWSLKLAVISTLIFPYLIVGITDSTFKMFYQVDIKKVVAFATVAEMHWLVLCFISGQNNLLLAGFFMLISHAIISTNSFLIVDSIARRFKTRLITEIYGLNYLTPKLFLTALLNCLVFLGFPGSLFFLAETLFFSFIFDLFPVYGLLLLILLYILLASFFWKIWMNVLFSSLPLFVKQLPLDLDRREFLIYMGLISIIFMLGLSNQVLCSLKSDDTNTIVL